MNFPCASCLMREESIVHRLVVVRGANSIKQLQEKFLKKNYVSVV